MKETIEIIKDFVEFLSLYKITKKEENELLFSLFEMKKRKNIIKRSLCPCSERNEKL